MIAQNGGTVGVVGLGIMGGAFARNLLAAGWRVIGYDIAAERRCALACLGAEIATDAADLARRVPAIIVSLPKPAALASTVTAIIKANITRRVVIETSTFALEDKTKAERALRNSGDVLLDCPVSGTGAQAKIKDIVIYASGGASEIRRLRPLFAAFSRAVHDVGAFGNGSRMKYVANLLVAIHNVASAEAMVLGIKAGLAPQQVYDVIRIGAGNSRVFELRAPMMVKGCYYDPSASVTVFQKDLAVIHAFAQAIGAPTPLLSATLPIYGAVLSTGHAFHDSASVCAVLETLAGLKRVKSRSRRGTRK